LQDLQDQSQGIFIGTGDRDNDFRISLFANFGNPGIQLLREEDGFVILNDVIPVPNVLNSEALDLLIDVNPETGELAFRYQRNSDPLPIPVGASSYIASGNLLNSLQNAPALAVGVIATSGEGPSYSASWDIIRISHPGPHIIDPYPDQQVFIGQPELIVPMELIFGIDGGIGSLSFEVSGNSNPQL